MNKLFFVTGPPGCGKSAYIARQAQRAVDQYGPDRVAIGSFTKAAAVTIAARDTHVRDDMIGTLHSWCYHAMGQPTIAESKIKEWNETHSRLALSQRFDASDPIILWSSEEGGDPMFQVMMMCRAKLIPEIGWPEHVRAFAREWRDWKEQNHYYDFTDLLEWGLRECNGAPGFPQALFIDEAQDNNPLQHQLVAQWSQMTETTILCGDPDQTIYSFAGSDPLAFYRAPKEQKLFPESLRQSWRVPVMVHEWAKRWISRIKERDIVEYAPKKEQGEIKAIFARSQDGEFILNEIEQQRPHGNVAVLATCAYMLRPTIEALRNAALPFYNPYRTTRADWNPLAHNAAPLLAFLKPCGATSGTNAALWNGPDLVRWSALVRAEGVFKRGGKTRINEWKDQPKLELADLFEVFEDGMLEQLLGRMDDGEKSATLWLRDHWINHDKMEKRFDYVIRVLEKHGMGGLLNTPDVIVGTGHSMKGGEADTVICFPDLSSSGRDEWSTPSGHDALVRLGYVMGTRAKHRLVLTGGIGGLW